ncbi:MAG TPA: hypothetical protein VLS45_08305, partial [Methylomicrobium sp.]|nr:hypothetical protein [Methylomicrobium sp.]
MSGIKFYYYYLQMFESCGGLGAVQTDFGCILYVMVLASEAMTTTDEGTRRLLLSRTNDVYRHLVGPGAAEHIDETGSPLAAVGAVRRLLTSVFNDAEVPVLVAAAEQTILSDRHRRLQFACSTDYGTNRGTSDLSNRESDMSFRSPRSTADGDSASVEQTLPRHASTPQNGRRLMHARRRVSASSSSDDYHAMRLASYAAAAEDCSRD